MVPNDAIFVEKLSNLTKNSHTFSHTFRKKAKKSQKKCDFGKNVTATVTDNWLKMPKIELKIEKNREKVTKSQKKGGFSVYAIKILNKLLYKINRKRAFFPWFRDCS